MLIEKDKEQAIMTKRSLKVESLIFDIDGTLWDSREIVAEGYNLQLRQEGLPQYCVTAEDLKSLFGKTMSEIADIMLAEVQPPERYDLMERCMAREQEYLHQSNCNIGYPKVKETLEERAKKYRLFIVSNSQKGYPEVMMEKLSITHLFAGHLCYGDTGTDKGTTIKILMEKHGIKDALYIGDTQGDYEATAASGIPFIWAAYGFGIPDGYAAKVDAFDELLEIL